MLKESKNSSVAFYLNSTEKGGKSNQKEKKNKDYFKCKKLK
jgi:hypothetical protein